MGESESSRSARGRHSGGRPSAPPMRNTRSRPSISALDHSAIQKKYAETAGLTVLSESLARIEAQLADARARGNACILALGWASGMVAKSGWLETDDQAYRSVLRQVPLYARAIESGLPFPKTRRIVFRENRPAELPGWAVLEIG